jgi:hypothetical protein
MNFNRTLLIKKMQMIKGLLILLILHAQIISYRQPNTDKHRQIIQIEATRTEPYDGLL